MYEVPNDWQELDEEEESDNGQELLSSYGPFSVILYARIKKLKLFPTSEADGFLEGFVGFYVKNAWEADKSGDALKNLKTLIGLFPTPKKFLQLLKFHKQKGQEMIFFKLAIDILENYYKLAEKPIFGKLQKDVFPLAAKFYKILSDETLKEITNSLRSCLRKSKYWCNKK